VRGCERVISRTLKRELRTLRVVALLVGALIFLSACVLRGAVAETVLPYVGLRTTNGYQPLPADSAAARPAPIHVGSISDEQYAQWHVPPFYKKTLTIRNLPVIGSEKVSDYAFLECAYLLDHMLQDSPPWVTAALVQGHVKVGIISVVEYTMDMPENQTPDNRVPAHAAFQDRRSRGLGARDLPTCAEENLLNLRGDPYTAENITLHEFSHTIASNLDRTRPGWFARLRHRYEQAMKQGLFAHTYSATNEQEYWAEGAQMWFNCAVVRKDSSVHNGIWHRAQLKAYDPGLAALLTEVFGDGAWRYVKTTNQPVVVEGVTYTRSPEDLAHLAGLQPERQEFPVFSFEKSPRIAAELQRRNLKHMELQDAAAGIERRPADAKDNGPGS